MTRVATPMASSRRPECPRTDLHHPDEPGGNAYSAWHWWAERITVSHRQARCPGCDRWAIYIPREPGAPICPDCHADRTTDTCGDWCGSTATPMPWETVLRQYDDE